MFGWYYNENTNTLNRYYDSELISTIQYDDEENYMFYLADAII